MVYGIRWGVIGERALTEAEVGKVTKHVAKWAKDVDGYDLYIATTSQPALQAFGSLDPSVEELEDELTLERLFDALGALRKLLRAFELRVEDDFNAYEWDGDGFAPTGKAGALVLPDVDNAHWRLASQASRPAKPIELRPGFDIFSDEPVGGWPSDSAIEAFLDNAELHGYRDRLDKGVMFEALRRPQMIGRVIEAWLRAVEGPSRKDIAASHYFAAFASEPAMFDTCIAILRAVPVDIDGYSDSRTVGACFLLSRAMARVDEATAVLVACLVGDSAKGWRDYFTGALAECDADTARAALLLDLAAGARIRGPYARAFARDPHAPSLFKRILDLPFAVRVAFDDWWRTESPTNEEYRRTLLEHPYWLVRWSAARAAPPAVRDGESEAVWRTIKGAETSLDSSAEHDFQYGLEEETRELPPLPSALAGLTSTCTDHRRWAIQYVDERRRARDAPALVLADELDEALAILRGYPRMRPRWSLWRSVVPELPLDAAARGKWARQHPDLDLMFKEVTDAMLHEVAHLGAEFVAARFPPPYLVLTQDERERAVRLVRDADKLGRKLLRLS